MPDVPRFAFQTIRGHVRVTILVTVNSMGEVIHETPESLGPSPYFARMAADAAMKWKFAQAEGQDFRQWLLHFEFTRNGATARVGQTRR
jgi:hypothetical protein